MFFKKYILKWWYHIYSKINNKDVAAKGNRTSEDNHGGDNMSKRKWLQTIGEIILLIARAIEE